MLKTQVITKRANSAPVEEYEFDPIENRPYSVKPRGGLWTSSFIDKDRISYWLEWCIREKFRSPEVDIWLLEPDPDAEVYVVDCYQDLHNLHLKWGLTKQLLENKPISYLDHTLDWEAMAQEGVDAVHLTEKGELETRGILEREYSLWGWDCESTIWLKWKFLNVMFYKSLSLGFEEFNFEAFMDKQEEIMENTLKER